MPDIRRDETITIPTTIPAPRGARELTRSIEVPWRVISTRHGGIRWTDHEIRAQFFDSYGHQREMTLDLRYRAPGISMDAARECALVVYVHPYRGAHGHAPIVLPRSRAKRIFDRLTELAESYPILLLNDDHEGNTHGAWEGLVRFMDSIIHGADPSVRLLP